MAVDDNKEFAQLFAAFTNGDVTVQERTRLTELAGRDVGRRGSLAEMEAVHEVIDVENQMRGQVMRPVDPGEEADESYRRLSRSAARAEEKLRANLMYPVADLSTLARGNGPRRPWFYFAAAAALLCASLYGLWPSGGAPGLDANKPGSSTLRGRSIYVTPQLSGDSPQILWTQVDGATFYDAVILDAAGQAVLPRAAELRRYNDWRLSEEILVDLRSREGQLYLLVIARDRTEQELARTEDPARLVLR
jgi:hypothetical protein